MAARGYAYVADFDRGLRVLTLADPTAPVEIAFHPLPGHTFTVALGGRYAYVPDGGCGLRILDVADPARLVVAGRYAAAVTVLDVAVVGRHAYVLALAPSALPNCSTT